MKRQLLTHCSIVLPDEVVDRGALLIEDGCIAALDPANTRRAREIDMAGTFVMPGMIDLHCDALEKEIEPRPNVLFPMDFAIAQADRRNAQAGITTVFHALSFAHGELGVRNRETAATIARHVRSYDHGLVDNRVHGRYEITDEKSLAVMSLLIEEGTLDFVSVMDHTPGQGQFKDLSAYREYLERTYGKSTQEAQTLIEQKMTHGKDALQRIAHLAAKSGEYGIRMASHDDDSPQRVQAMAHLGGTVSEFPVNFEAAKAALDYGLWTVFGAPNILRGGSQSGSMKALEAVQKNVAGCICSDYHPGTLLTVVFKLPRLAEIDLSGAVRLVTAHPAAAAGYDDRGSIEEGKKADLIGVRFKGEMPCVSHLWVNGELRYQEGH